MHPLVRELYKRVLLTSLDYPHPKGIAYVRQQWKIAIRNPKNGPSCYSHDNANDNVKNISNSSDTLKKYTKQQEKEIRKSVAKGYAMIREMIGIIQLKKYRAMKNRYS